MIVALFEGLSIGATYALVGLGLVLAFRTTGVLSFAHGQLMLVGVFLIGSWQVRGFASMPIQLILGLIVVSAICMAFYWLVLRFADGMPPFIGFIATLGLASILDAALVWAFGSSTYRIVVPGLPDATWEILGSRVSAASVVVAVISLVIAALVALGVQGTEIGIRMRAGGQNPILAAQSGIRIRPLFLIAWGLTGVLAVLAGVAFASTRLATLDMISLMLAAFPAIFLGGMDSTWGAIVGGLVIGALQGVTLWLLGSQYIELITWSALLVVMLFLPHGLFGTRNTVRV